MWSQQARRSYLRPVLAIFSNSFSVSAGGQCLWGAFRASVSGGKSPVPAASQLLERIAKDGRRVGNVVDRTRDLVKKAPLRMEPVEMNGAISEVIELTRGEATKNHISMRAQLAEDLPLVVADRIQLQQVMLNLIVNATHALIEGSHAERELVISTSTNGSSDVLVSVRDSGKGISPQQLERLFDPFYTTKPSGMGMGLSICRSIVEAHGGRIWVTANAPQGAAFYFTLPAASK
jgi:signal transduction histidine kinase